jgi:ATP-dependent RNA helicase DOB1
MQIDVETFVKSFRPDIMEVVYACAKGSKFYEIMEITQVSIIFLTSQIIRHIL